MQRDSVPTHCVEAAQRQQQQQQQQQEQGGWKRFGRRWVAESDVSADSDQCLKSQSSAPPFCTDRMSYNSRTHLSNGYPIEAVRCLGYSDLPIDELLNKYKKCMCEVGVKSHCPKGDDKLESTSSHAITATGAPTTRTTTTTTTTARTPVTRTRTTTWWRPPPDSTSNDYRQHSDVYHMPSSSDVSLGEVVGFGLVAMFIVVGIGVIYKVTRERRRIRHETAGATQSLAR